MTPDQRIAELEAENERQVGANKVLARRFNELQAHNLALVAALKKYGNHLSSCGCLELYEKEAECDCGLTEALSPQASMEALREIVGALQQHEDLMNESRGVCGLHLNGDEALWDWLKQDWLSKHDSALTTAEKVFGIKGESK